MMSQGSTQIPIVTSDLSTDYLTRAINASFLGMLGRLPNGSELAYWIDKSQNAAEYSDQVWRVGWNAYWEARINSGSADPHLGDQPAHFQPTNSIPVSIPIPVPIPIPTPIPVPPPISIDYTPVLNEIAAANTRIANILEKAAARFGIK